MQSVANILFFWLLYGILGSKMLVFHWLLKTANSVVEVSIRSYVVFSQRYLFRFCSLCDFFGYE